MQSTINCRQQLVLATPATFVQQNPNHTMFENNMKSLFEHCDTNYTLFVMLSFLDEFLRYLSNLPEAFREHIQDVVTECATKKLEDIYKLIKTLYFYVQVTYVSSVLEIDHDFNVATEPGIVEFSGVFRKVNAMFNSTTPTSTMNCEGFEASFEELATTFERMYKTKYIPNMKTIAEKDKAFYA